ncbi:MAG: hypothetical protein J6U54_19225 [Clostridiales bacterium]|nr:hypothetical protein [Clostridiales bacterium]
MVIESHEINKNYAKEFINVVSMGMILMKDPHKSLRDNFAIVPGIIFGSVFGAIIAVILKLKIDHYILDCFIAGMAIIFILAVFYYLRIWSSLNKDIKKERNVTYTFDETGIEYDDHKSDKIITKWESYGSVIFFEHGIYFIPNGNEGALIGITIDHKDEILSFLKENEIDIEICK